VPALPSPSFVEPFPSRQPVMTTSTLGAPGGTCQVAVCIIEGISTGRVIRTEHDRGVVILIDDRFARPDALRLLPR
jgi:hypothetical protein